MTRTESMLIGVLLIALALLLALGL